MTTWLRSEVRKSFAPPWNALTERTIFGRLDPDQIVEAIDAACRHSLGEALRDGFLYQVSAGVVIGCELTDGRRVVLKAYQPTWSPAFLSAVKRTQTALHTSGYPCPRPIDGELTVGDARVLVESELRDPGVGTATGETRAVLAASLADLVNRCRPRHEPAIGQHPLRRPYEGAFPEPHSPIFDFAATRRGAEWIEDIALRARRVVEADTSPRVIAHTDWSLRNVRVRASRLTAAYDWDSLALVREAEAVAMAATTWCKTGAPGDPTPTIEDIEAYATAYEAARGEPFTSGQHLALRAAAAALAYTARCEHAIDPEERTWTTTRPRLREAAAWLT